MEISVNSGVVALQFEFVKFDANDPQSVQFKVELGLSHPTGTFSYSADDIWLDADMWNCFERALNSGLKEKAVFNDQSQYLEISLEKRSTHIALSVNVKEPLRDQGDISMSSFQKLDLDSSFINSLRDQFREFPRIW